MQYCANYLILLLYEFFCCFFSFRIVLCSKFEKNLTSYKSNNLPSTVDYKIPQKIIWPFLHKKCKIEWHCQFYEKYRIFGMGRRFWNDKYFFLDSDQSTSTNSHDNTYTLDDANDTLNDMLGQHPGSKNAITNFGSQWGFFLLGIFWPVVCVIYFP